MREAGYRDQALRMFPWICGRCARVFTAANVHELTVHHRDHDHDHNPPDGSNWELLCLYCHDNEHRRELEARAAGPRKPAPPKVATGQPLSGLKDLFDKSKS